MHNIFHKEGQKIESTCGVWCTHFEVLQRYHKSSVCVWDMKNNECIPRKFPIFMKNRRGRTKKGNRLCGSRCLRHRGCKDFQRWKTRPLFENKKSLKMFQSPLTYLPNDFFSWRLCWPSFPVNCFCHCFPKSVKQRNELFSSPIRYQFYAMS